MSLLHIRYLKISCNSRKKPTASSDFCTSHFAIRIQRKTLVPAELFLIASRNQNIFMAQLPTLTIGCNKVYFVHGSRGHNLRLRQIFLTWRATHLFFGWVYVYRSKWGKFTFKARSWFVLFESSYRFEASKISETKANSKVVSSVKC